MFSITSRYYNSEVATLETPDGRMVAYLRRRFLPPAGSATVYTEHLVTEGDRLDNITARYLGDPEQFWRICDANNALRPDDLTSQDEIGQRLQIPLPQQGG